MLIDIELLQNTMYIEKNHIKVLAHSFYCCVDCKLNWISHSSESVFGNGI